MNAKLSARVLVILSIVYGSTLALLGALGVGQRPLATVATIGALLVGGLWVVRGVLTERK